MTADGGRVVAVRPFGYVEPHPVVRRVGDTCLFVGNERAADPDGPDRSFDAVVSATREPRARTTHHRPLADGPEVDPGAFADAVVTVRRLRRTAEAVLVHCAAGVSRSPALVAATLAVDGGGSLRESLATVRAGRPVATPHPAVFEAALSAVLARQ